MIKIVDNYTLTEYLGKGEYGKVYKAYNIDTKIDVAIKMIPLSRFEDLPKLVELTRNQLEILKLLEHNINVINFVEMIKTNRYIYLVYEYCEGGTLEDLVRSRGSLPEKEALRIFKQLINAFRSLNENNILHRDVKPNNIFFKSGHLKLADFGFCKKLKNHDDLAQTSLGSPLYMAPEVLNGDVYDSKADIWSVGIVLYEMLFGRCPYGDCNIKQLINIYSAEKVRVPMSVDNIFISPATENMLRRMLQRDQLKRISWEDLFYEYEIDEYGNLSKKEKDFQYDLMKLMKRNSSLQGSSKTKPISTFKFDWTKITDKNSSVHSQQLDLIVQDPSQNLDQICIMKKKVKEFQSEYDRRLQLSSIIDEMLNSTQQLHYSPTICYFLVYNLNNIIKNGLPELQLFLNQYKTALQKCPNETNMLNKMIVVFRNEAETLTTRLNSIKMSLLSSQGFSRNCLKYPAQAIISSQVSKFVDLFEEKFPGIKDLFSTNLDSKVRNHMVYLVKMLWGISLIKQQPKSKDIISISIKNQTPIREISRILNRLLVYVNS